MNFRLMGNTEHGGMSLHNNFGYAMCPYKKAPMPCGTWCALFHLNENRKSVMQACAGKTIYFGEKDETTT